MSENFQKDSPHGECLPFKNTPRTKSSKAYEYKKRGKHRLCHQGVRSHNLLRKASFQIILVWNTLNEAKNEEHPFFE